MLPENTEKLLSNFIEGKEITFCNLTSNSENNEYTFSFPYSDKYHVGNKTKTLLQKTNIYLKVQNSLFPLLSESDYIFSNVQEDSVRNTNDFNFCFITVNAQGELIDGFAY